MENIFLKYMRERIGDKHIPSSINPTLGPVITVSREYGCPAERIVEKLAQILSTKKQRIHGEGEWRWISKEIINQSAKELNLSPTLMQDVAEYRDRSIFENVSLFFSEGYYPSDTKINNSIARIVHNAAAEGRVIILGRAAESITRDIDLAFHIKLQAPIDWRAQNVSIDEHISFSDAKKRVIEMDRRREQFRRYFEGDRPDSDFFDATYNCSTLSDDEIIEMTIILAESRGFVY